MWEHFRDMTLEEILFSYKEWDDTPLDGDEVEGFIEMLRRAVNYKEWNITDEDYLFD